MKKRRHSNSYSTFLALPSTENATATFDSHPAFPGFRTFHAPLPLPLHRTFHAFPPSSIRPQSPSIRAPIFPGFRTPRPSSFASFALSLAENANRGPDCKENAPVWQKTPLGGLIRQEMRRPLGHIGKGSLLPRRKTAGQRIIHHELPQDSQNPNLATRPPSGVFCQMSPASPQCPLGSPSKQSDWRAFRAICPASFPNDLPGELSERPARRASQAVLHASRGQRQVRRPRCRRRIRQRISQWPHDACAHRSADESPSATPTTLPLFQKTLRPFSMWLAKANARKERP